MIDASVVININATNLAVDILHALGDRIVVVDTVVEELAAGAGSSRDDAARLKALISAGVIDQVSLGPVGSSHFESLVAGEAIETLDDGEAASISYALEKQVSVVIDERKANRICRERFPALPLSCSVDLLLHPAVSATLSANQLASAILRALQHARMQVPAQHLIQIVSLIGAEEAARCPSLPRSVRGPVR